MAEIALEQASQIIGQITTLDAKMHNLIKNMEAENIQFANNKKEIEKRINLEAVNVAIDAKIKSLSNEIHEMKAQRDGKADILTKAGWVIPIPQNHETVRGFVAI
jgi:multidrug resistance efflux pump